jgi:hypothetical protein
MHDEPLADPHLESQEDDEHVAPVATIPQGMQTPGVEFGHEERDILLQPLLGWFAALAVVVAVTIGVMRVGFELWDNAMKDQEAKAAPRFRLRIVPPAPRILPNPIDSGPLDQALWLPPERPKGELERQDRNAAGLGLYDTKEQSPHISDDLVRKVAARPEAAGAGAMSPGTAVEGADGHEPGRPQENMPSDASGGLATEDRIR